MCQRGLTADGGMSLDGAPKGWYSANINKQVEDAPEDNGRHVRQLESLCAAGAEQTQECSGEHLMTKGQAKMVLGPDHVTIAAEPGISQ